MGGREETKTQRHRDKKEIHYCIYYMRKYVQTMIRRLSRIDKEFQKFNYKTKKKKSILKTR